MNKYTWVACEQEEFLELRDTQFKKVKKEKLKADSLPLLCLPSGWDVLKLTRVKSSLVLHREKPKKYFIMMIKNTYHIN